MSSAWDIECRPLYRQTRVKGRLALATHGRIEGFRNMGTNEIVNGESPE